MDEITLLTIINASFVVATGIIGYLIGELIGRKRGYNSGYGHGKEAGQLIALLNLTRDLIKSKKEEECDNEKNPKS